MRQLVVLGSLKGDAAGSLFGSLRQQASLKNQATCLTSQSSNVLFTTMYIVHEIVFFVFHTHL